MPGRARKGVLGWPVDNTDVLYKRYLPPNRFNYPGLESAPIIEIQSSAILANKISVVYFYRGEFRITSIIIIINATIVNKVVNYLKKDIK